MTIGAVFYRRHRKLAFVACAVICGLCWLGAGVGAPSGPGGTLPEVTDLGLYEDIAARVAGGDSYYQAAAEEHRRGGHPLFPFYTVRPPLLAWITAFLGPDGARALAVVLVLLGAFAWSIRLHKASFAAGEVVAAGLLYCTGTFYFLATEMSFHGAWAGSLVGIAAALLTRERYLGAIALGCLAAMMREFAVIFLGAGFALALWRRDWRQIFAWIAGMAVVLLYYAGHAYMVGQVRLPSDISSQGWLGLQGPIFAIQNGVGFSILRTLGRPLGGAVLLLAMFGWAGAARGGRALFLFGSGVLMLTAVAARGDNGYWILLLTPWTAAGLAFIPRLCRDAFVAMKKGTDHRPVPL